MNSVFFNRINTQEIKEKLASGEFPFSQNLFWDTPLDKIDREHHKRHIIERVLTRGLLEDFYALIHMYNNEEIRDAIHRSKSLDSKTANFCSLLFGIPKNEIHVSPYYG